MRLRRGVLVAAMALAPLLILLLTAGGLLFMRQGGFAPLRVPAAATLAVSTDPAVIARGAYLARLGNCGTCHTPRGGQLLAGGRGFKTPYGTVYSSNLTPDPVTGLGAWSVEEFRHAMRHGVSRNGLLYPVFPFANFARLTDADLDALLAYLRSVPAVVAERPANTLTFPASWRGALLAWRMLHYRSPASTASSIPATVPTKSADWNRGRYLVDGLGHCAMCHSTRGAMGSLPADGYLAGGRIPGQGWYAPALNRTTLARFDVDTLAAYLQSGTSGHGAAYGPMAEVVFKSLRHITAQDAVAMAVYLQDVPAAPPVRRRAAAFAAPRATPDPHGAKLYAQHCESCHGVDGRGEGSRYPSLHGAVAVVAPDPINAVRIVLYGAVAPTTAANPQPHSMPPFAQTLGAADIAAVVNYLRGRWGNAPAAVTTEDVARLGSIEVD